LSYIGTQMPSPAPAPGSVVSIGRRIKPAAGIRGACPGKNSAEIREDSGVRGLAWRPRAVILWMEWAS